MFLRFPIFVPPTLFFRKEELQRTKTCVYSDNNFVHLCFIEIVYYIMNNRIGYTWSRLWLLCLCNKPHWSRNEAITILTTWIALSPQRGPVLIKTGFASSELMGDRVPHHHQENCSGLELSRHTGVWSPTIKWLHHLHFEELKFEDVAQCWSACLACMRSWAQPPVLPRH